MSLDILDLQLLDELFEPFTELGVSSTPFILAGGGDLRAVRLREGLWTVS